MKHRSNRGTYSRVQSFVYNNTAEAFHTIFSEALYIITGNASIVIKTKDAAKHHAVLEGKRKSAQVDMEVEPKNWPNPAHSVKV